MVDTSTMTYVANPPLDGGVLRSAKLGTTMPATTYEELAAAFLANDYGEIGDSGFAINRTKTTTKTRKFGGGVSRVITTETDSTVKITLNEVNNPVVLRAINGAANVTVHDPNEHGQQITVYQTSDDLPIESWVIDSIDGEQEKRHVIEKGQIIEIAEVVNVHTALTQYQVTIQVYESTTNARKGVNVIELINDTTKAVVSPLAISTTTLPAGKVGTPYSQTLTSTGGTGAKKWTSTGTLPAGLTLSLAGVLSGTPTAASTPSITFKVTDSATPAVEVTKAIVVTVTV
ncbi:Ig domain-containing protein [Rhodococcus sp. IEGM 1366]|uniref:Ig domain-containing protein n=1 Tax=Rhodococcus sp. IEGM 1366 TaxID=3082223 RepID=UPI00295503C4|nr:Ig domain-containing protein [Rhodococcus sp. IEGM 1366]MDV8066389.1 Ig domain-containing protein [Rhodococcus sp. IEGM 1366]